MRWKWLLVLSLISISLVVVSGDDGDDTENVETVNDNYDDEEESEDNVIADETLTEAPGEEAPKEDEQKTEGIVDGGAEENNEDTVDVEVGKHKGKLMAYDDYQWQAAQDVSDSNYNWNGECSWN